MWPNTSAYYTVFMLTVGGAKDKQSKCIRWPWIMTTVAACGVDLVATVTYANDSFHTRVSSAFRDDPYFHITLVTFSPIISLLNQEGCFLSR